MYELPFVYSTEVSAVRAIMVRVLYDPIETTARVPFSRAQHVLPYYELFIALAWAIPKAATQEQNRWDWSLLYQLCKLLFLR